MVTLNCIKLTLHQTHFVAKTQAVDPLQLIELLAMNIYRKKVTSITLFQLFLFWPKQQQ